MNFTRLRLDELTRLVLNTTHSHKMKFLKLAYLKSTRESLKKKLRIIINIHLIIYFIKQRTNIFENHF